MPRASWMRRGWKMRRGWRMSLCRVSVSSFAPVILFCYFAIFVVFWGAGELGVFLGFSIVFLSFFTPRV